MKIWVDDIRPAPKDYIWLKTVEQAIIAIKAFELLKEGEYESFEDYMNNLKNLGYEGSDIYFFDNEIEVIDLDHDAGDYVKYGGDYIKILDYLEATKSNYPIRIHTANPVGRENMRLIIHKNKWKEIF